MISSHAYNVISKSYSLKFLLKVTKGGGTVSPSEIWWLSGWRLEPCRSWTSWQQDSSQKQLCREGVTGFNHRRDVFTKMQLHLNVVNKEVRGLAITTPVLLGLEIPSPLLVSAWLPSSLLKGKLNPQGTTKAGCGDVSRRDCRENTAPSSSM